MQISNHKTANNVDAIFAFENNHTCRQLASKQTSKPTQNVYSAFNKLQQQKAVNQTLYRPRLVPWDAPYTSNEMFFKPEISGAKWKMIPRGQSTFTDVRKSEGRAHKFPDAELRDFFCSDPVVLA
jgi:hypothetical protein